MIFSYTIDDGFGGTATGTVEVTITGQNDEPVAAEDTYGDAGPGTGANEDTVFTVSAAEGLLANDSDIDELAAAGIPVAMDRSPAHMHHKFALFDGRILLNGSYNWTRSAAADNEENIVLSSDVSLLAGFSAQFERLWQTWR